MLSDSEYSRLEAIGKNSSYSFGVNSSVTKYSYSNLRHYVRGNVLELGPAEGIMTEELVSDGHNPILVEGSESLCSRLRIRFPQLNVENKLFETYESKVNFDTVIMGHVLEHVAEPIDILRKYKTMLSPSGLIWASVPNANSLHRQAAVEMNLLKNVQELNEADSRHGHRRVYKPEEFREIFAQAGLKVLEFGGYWLKPLANIQIERWWSDEMVYAFCKLGRKYPEISGEMFIVASL
jgi:2-polyprenyl-3-methyl-5-hydroxy-6-metoxy-1,4-benzoquinol methylase